MVQKRSAPEAPIRDCWIEQVTRRKYVDGTEELKNYLKRRKEALVVPGGALDTERFEDVQKLLRYKEDGTVQVHKWITEVPYDAFKGLAKACKEDRLEEKDLRSADGVETSRCQRTQTRIEFCIGGHIVFSDRSESASRTRAFDAWSPTQTLSSVAPLVVNR